MGERDELLAVSDGALYPAITRLTKAGLLDQHTEPGASAAPGAVLRRRLEFLEAPSSFFYRGGEPVRAEEADDLFRQGMLRVARATGAAERAWLTEAIELLDQPPT